MLVKMSEEFKKFRIKIRNFVELELEPIAVQVEEDEKIPEVIVEKMRRLGLFGLSIPKRYGGLGLTTLEEIMIYEEKIGRAPWRERGCPNA